MGGEAVLVSVSAACQREKGEYRGAVVFDAGKMGVTLVVVGVGMLHDEGTARKQQIFLENNERDLIHVWQGIGRIGKNEMVLAGVLPEESEHIVSDDVHFASDAQFGSGLLNKIDRSWISLNYGELTGTTGCQLVGDAASASEELERSNTFKVDGISKHVEQAFFGELGSRPGGYTSRRVESSSAEFSAYDTHVSSCCASLMAPSQLCENAVPSAAVMPGKN